VYNLIVQKEIRNLNSEDFLKLDNQLCFAIYACSREITRLYRPILEKLELTYPQFLTLVVLWEQKRLTVKEIGERLYLDSGTLTPMLKRMEAMDLLARVRARDDERKVFIELTDKGNKLRAAALELPEKCIPHFGLTREEYTDLLCKMNQMITNLQKVTRN
jgi:MarR family transcriptional regulator, organic hydroperoxide resistance regulator